MGFFGDLFGGGSKKGKHQVQEAGALGTQLAAQGQQLGAQYDKGASASIGANAADYMRKAQESARGLAEEQARTAATQGTRAATQAARTAGLNKGQAALTGIQRAGDIYTNTQQGALQQGIGNYMAGTGQIAGQGAEMANRVATGAGMKLGSGGAQLQDASQRQANTMSMVGGLAGAGATLLSDERAKTDVGEAPNLRQMLEHVKPKMFRYRAGGGPKVGIMAQDLERTPMAGAVKETPRGKMIDTAQLTAANTAMIKQLYDRLKGGEHGAV